MLEDVVQMDEVVLTTRNGLGAAQMQLNAVTLPCNVDRVIG